MFVTLEGIATFVRLLQFSKAEEPMLGTPSAIFALVNTEQFWNAELPIVVTLAGIVILVKLLHP